MPSATPPEKAEKCFCRNHHQGIDGNADHDRGHAVQHIGGEADQVAKAVAPVFRQINARADAQGQPDHAGDRQDQPRAHDRIRHASA